MPWKKLEVDAEADALFLAQFRRRPRLLVDENVHAGLAGLASASGLNVRSVRSIRKGNISDEEVFQVARRQGRVIVTHDRHDFWNDRKFPIDQTAGIAILDGGDSYAIGVALPFLREHAELWVGMKGLFNRNGETSLKRRNITTGRIETTRFRGRRNSPTEIWEP